MPAPNPLQLFRLLDSGRITAEDFRAAMLEHQQELIGEMEEAFSDPDGSWLDQIWNRRAVNKLTARHGEKLIREVLLALAEVEDFPPAKWLWNAMHPHVPLHVFFRSRRPPLFRFSAFEAAPQRVRLVVEHSGKGETEASTTQFVLRRDRSQRLWVEEQI